MSRKKSLPDFRLLEGVVSKRIIDAARAASEMLTKADIDHVLIGGLAVGAYGYVRATKDIDFLVGEEAFEHHEGGIVTMKPGVPILVDDVVVDTLSDEGIDVKEEGSVSDGMPIVSPEVLVYLKLKAHRRRDKEDIVELLRAGLDEDACRAFLEENAPDLVDRFEELVEMADDEEES